MIKNYIKKIAIILAILGLDQVTKILLEGKNFTIIDGVLSFTSTHNTGAAWSMFDGQIALFVVGAIIFTVLMFVFDYFQKENRFLYIMGFTLMLAGAIGNAIDRIIFGYVRDFIKLDFITFPVFNVADMSLVIGAILFSVFVLFIADKKAVKK